MKRRDFIGLLGAAGAALVGRRYFLGGSQSYAPPRSTRMTAEVTPNSEFYITQYDGVPEVELGGWNLRITGEVEQEIAIGLDDLRTLEETVDYNTIICIGNGVGGDLIGNAEWRGVRLRDVLELAGLKESAVELALYGADGYMDTFPVEKGLQDGTRLVYEMNSEPLPPEHGFPLRCVVPGLYGIKNVKWIERIDVLSENIRGYWQKRGWSENGRIKVMSRIDTPQNGETVTAAGVVVSGIAFAGEHPIERVEVSTDGGAVWHDAALKPALSEYAWTLWSYDWRNPGPGDYEIAVRASDASGRVQQKGTVISRRVYPDGADGYHRITINVV